MTIFIHKDVYFRVTVSAVVCRKGQWTEKTQTYCSHWRTLASSVIFLGTLVFCSAETGYHKCIILQCKRLESSIGLPESTKINVGRRIT